MRGGAIAMYIKICGITCVEDADEVARLGGNAIGLNFYPSSPRSTSESAAKEILRSLPPSVVPIGLLVSPTAEHVQRCHLHLGLSTLQLHAADLDRLVSTLPGLRSLRVILAFPIRDPDSLGELQREVERWRQTSVTLDAVLVDAHVAGRYGGTGQLAPWSVLANFDPGLPMILAGGLTPENVAEAIRIVRPSGVDVASGVERNPGRKDPEKIRRFIGQAREAAAKYRARLPEWRPFQEPR